MARRAVIGLECHIQLATRTKMFCACPAEFGAAPNTHVCPVCLGLPGALPLTSGAAVDAAVRLGLALGCEVRETSVFARKNYFYPDMPKNYQITQYDRPLCVGGSLPVTLDGTERRFALTRVHVEEDTGKSFHPERVGDRRVSRLDFNRAGVPLLELVTEPVFDDPEACAAFLTTLRRLVRWLGISGGDMEKGQLRCDANVSLRTTPDAPLGTKTEIKNMNTIRGLEHGIRAEIARQGTVLDQGGRVEQATLLYDADHDRLAVMRSKEHAHDYRYFPEPDLPLLRVSRAAIDEARTRLPELPWDRARRFVARHGLPAYDAEVLTTERSLADYFETIVRNGVEAKKASNWVMTEVLRHTKDRPLADWIERVPAAVLAEAITRVERVTLTGSAAKEILERLFRDGGDARALFDAHTARGSDDDLLPLVRAVIAEHPGPVEQYRRGKTVTLGFLVGQVMKKSGGRAVAQRVQELLRVELVGGDGAP
ncbi:MAG TPA: Asp-tRNA(Asn)/Glu-tRNA(Gln) amidotransferase subunit GatB [Dongiaceae bacterium]|nr:Asp-tRNA(Asn)/Glu-tRNA(Gln) amidotransferase subunit GatB [Dongiaceae bacterium]